MLAFPTLLCRVVRSSVWGWETHGRGCVLISTWVFPGSASYHCWELKLGLLGQRRVCPVSISLLACLQFCERASGDATSVAERSCKIRITGLSYTL